MAWTKSHRDKQSINHEHRGATDRIAQKRLREMKRPTFQYRTDVASFFPLVLPRSFVVHREKRCLLRSVACNMAKADSFFCDRARFNVSHESDVFNFTLYHFCCIFKAHALFCGSTSRIDTW